MHWFDRSTFYDSDQSSSGSISAPGEHHPAPVLQAQNVTKKYGRVIALSGVSFQVAPGESLALWGANGAGKSTLIKAILGLVNIQGQILVDGHDTQLQGKLARSRVGYVPQEANFYDMGLAATLYFYARLRQVDRNRIPVLISQLGLQEHAEKRVSALSGGLKQRLALALALLSDPPLLLLDEPTANLDIHARRDYLGLLNTLRQQNKTIIFASHRLEEVEMLANRVLVLEAGQAKQQITPPELRAILSPEFELTLWVAAEQRQPALKVLQEKGLAGHLNGRGTVVIRASNTDKVLALETLKEHGITVLDFETERGELWS